MPSLDPTERWLSELTKGKRGTIDFSFPDDQIKLQYLASIEQRSDAEVLDLLRKFLISSGTLGADRSTLAWLLHSLRQDDFEPSQLSEFQRRLLAFYGLTRTRRARSPPWEGITWVLDVLQNNPRAALTALDAYLEAHIAFMPDGRIHGMLDAAEIIRAKYIERPNSLSDAVKLLLAESPRTLERLVARLYSEMGYATVLTPSQRDGGFDVLATRTDAGQRSQIHVECKRWERNVGEPILRQLLGVLSDSKATSGVCVTTSDLTASAKRFVKGNPRLDFIHGRKLVEMLNEHFGPSWFLAIERLLSTIPD